MLPRSRHVGLALFLFSAVSTTLAPHAAQSQMIPPGPNTSVLVDFTMPDLSPGATPLITLRSDAAGPTRTAEGRGGRALTKWTPDRVIVKLKSELADDVDRRSDEREAAAFLAHRVSVSGSVAPSSVEPVFKIALPPGLTRSAAFRRQIAENLEKMGAKPASLKAPPAVNAIYRLTLSEGSDVRRACVDLAASHDVIWAEPEYVYTCQMVPNDPYYSSSGAWGQSYADMWGLRATEPESAWDQTQGDGVVVAVIDTGIDFGHEDLYRDSNGNGRLDKGEQYNVWINPGEDRNHNGLFDASDVNNVDDDGNGYVDDIRGWDFISYDNNPADDHGHGTHVAGTIAAIAGNNRGIAGIAPRARILTVKCLGSNGSGTTSQLANGIVYAVNSGAKVLNNSWGGSGTSQTIFDAVQYARSLNRVVVAAAGNMAMNAGMAIPSGTPGVLTVAALDANLQRASFSNFGSAVEVSAPGVDVLSLRAAGTDMYGDGNHFVPAGASTAQYYRSNGTSMACPFAAGLAALVIARDSSLPEYAVRRTVTESAAPLPVQDLYLGTGLIRCDDALALTGGIARSEGELRAPSDVEARTSQQDLDVVAKIGAGTYTLQIGQGYYPTAWTDLASGSGPVDGVLATLSMAGKQGPYHLRLVLRENGRTGYEHTVFQADAALHQGWPVNVGGGVFYFGDFVLGCSYAATMADVNADDQEEIFVGSGGFTFGFAGDGSFLPGWPTTQNQYPAYLSNNDLPGPSVEDVNGDGSLEILWTLRDYYPDSPSSPWRAWCFNGKRSNGSNLASFPQQAPDTYSNAFELPFVLGDLDGDGLMEATTVHTKGNTQYSYRMTALTHKGTRLFTRDLADTTESFVGLSFGDIDADGTRELVAVSAASTGSRLLYLHVFDASGQEQSGYPMLLYTPLSSEYVAAAPFLADLDADGDLEIVLPLGGGQSRIRFFHHNATPLAVTGVLVGNNDCQLLNCVLGDVDADGQTEVIATANYRPILNGPGSNRIYVARLNGSLLPGWPFPLAEDPMSRPAIVDVDKDGRQDVCFTTNAGGGTNSGLLYAISGDGVVVPGYPKRMSFGSTSGVSAGDVDGDGLYELVTATMAGSIYVWDLPTPALVARADWPLPGVNRRNTNVFRDRAWPVAPGDTDTDGDVDAADLSRFAQCASGSLIPFSTPRLCRSLDFDGDGDIDQSDFGVLQRCFSGADNPAEPGCGG